jgi:hypothetical protein
MEKDKNYIVFHKKRFLHIFLVVVLYILISFGSFLILLISPGSLKFYFIPMFCLQLGCWLGEYRDWIEEKYPKEIKKESNNAKDL